MTQATATTLVEVKTCSNCLHFNNFHKSNGRGWCQLFDRQAREHHEITNDCITSSDLTISYELEDNLDVFPDINLEELEAFPSEVIELNRNGYPMTESAPTGYFSTDFVTNPDERF